jgi:hypothetical protein
MPNSSTSLARLPGPMPKMRRPPLIWSNIATSAATVAGWLCGRLMTPVPRRMRDVLCSTPARKISGEVTRSLPELVWAPT